VALTQLCQVADVKNRLEIPSSDVSRDAILDAFRGAVEERILDITHFTFTGGVVTEQLIDVQLGVSRVMSQRPIIPLPGTTSVSQFVQLSARAMASDTFSNIIGELRDPFEGRITALASELTPIFPPIGGLAPWFRWRQMIWPVVKFTYNVQPLGDGTGGTFAAPKSLITAAIEWTAFIYSKTGGGGIQTLNLERVSENYGAMVNLPQPAVVRMLLAKYIPRQVEMAF